MKLLKGDDLRRKRLGKAVMVMQREGFSEAEITDLLRDRDWREAMWAYRDEYARHRWWKYTERVEDALIAFGLENGRWPEHREWRLYNGLPSWNTAMHYGFYHQRIGGVRWNHVRSTDGLWGCIARRATELTAPLVLTIPNMTCRRDAVANFGGVEALIKKGGGRQIQQDDYGILWSMNAEYEGMGDRIAHYVEVVNSTPKMHKVDGVYVPELDKQGKEQFDHYFLRVPPTVWTAKVAVAWTGWFEQFGAQNNPLLVTNFERFAAQS